MPATASKTDAPVPVPTPGPSPALVAQLARAEFADDLDVALHLAAVARMIAGGAA